LHEALEVLDDSGADGRVPQQNASGHGRYVHTEVQQYRDLEHRCVEPDEPASGDAGSTRPSQESPTPASHLPQARSSPRPVPEEMVPGSEAHWIDSPAVTEVRRRVPWRRPDLSPRHDSRRLLRSSR